MHLSDIVTRDMILSWFVPCWVDYFVCGMFVGLFCALLVFQYSVWSPKLKERRYWKEYEQQCVEEIKRQQKEGEGEGEGEKNL